MSPVYNPPPTGGTGDVIGPATNTDLYLPQWSGANSKTLANGVAVPAGGLAGITALDLKAPLASPTFTGNVTLPATTRRKTTVQTGTAARTISGAQMASGDIQQLTGTVARTFTLDTGTNLSTAVGSVATGDTVSFLLANASTQTLTLNGATGTTLANAVTVATLQSRMMYAVNTGTNTWTIY